MPNNKKRRAKQKSPPQSHVNTTEQITPGQTTRQDNGEVKAHTEAQPPQRPHPEKPLAASLLHIQYSPPTQADDNYQKSNSQSKKKRKKRKKASKAKQVDSDNPNSGSETSEQETELAHQDLNSIPTTPSNHDSPHTRPTQPDDISQQSGSKSRKKRKKANKAKQVDSNNPNSGSETGEQETQLAQQDLNSIPTTPSNHDSPHTRPTQSDDISQQSGSPPNTHALNEAIKYKLSQCIETIYDIITSNLHEPCEKPVKHELTRHVLAYLNVTKWEQLYKQVSKSIANSRCSQNESTNPTPPFNLFPSEEERAANKRIEFYSNIQTIVLSCQSATQELKKQKDTPIGNLMKNVLDAAGKTLDIDKVDKLELSDTDRQLLREFIFFCGNITNSHNQEELTLFRTEKLKYGQQQSMKSRASLDNKRDYFFKPIDIHIEKTLRKAPILEAPTHITNRSEYEQQLQACLTELSKMIPIEYGQHYRILRNTLDSPYQLLCINNSSDFCSFNQGYHVSGYKNARIHDCGRATEQIGASVIFTHQNAKTKLSCYTRVLELRSSQQPSDLYLSSFSERNTQIGKYIRAVDAVTNEYLSNQKKKKKIPSCIVNAGFFTLEKIPPLQIKTPAETNILGSLQEFALITINGQIDNTNSIKVAENLKGKLEESNKGLIVFYIEKNAAPVTSQNVRIHCETLFALFIEKLMSQFQQELDQSTYNIFCQKIPEPQKGTLYRSYSAPSPTGSSEEEDEELANYSFDDSPSSPRSNLATNPSPETQDPLKQPPPAMEEGKLRKDTSSPLSVTPHIDTSIPHPLNTSGLFTESGKQKLIESESYASKKNKKAPNKKKG